MTTKFFDNFNNDPVSTEVKTGTYVIPAGQYARVTVLEFFDTFTIDSVITIPATVLSSGSGSGIGVRYQNLSPYTMYGSVTNNSGGAASINTNGGAQITSVPAASTIVTSFSSRDYIYQSHPSGSILWNLVASDRSPKSQDFWVPEGTSLNGTRYVVVLYNKQGA